MSSNLQKGSQYSKAKQGSPGPKKGKFLKKFNVIQPI